MSRIGFIGTGHIAAPMIRFLADRGHQITVSERGAALAAELHASHGVAIADNQAVLDQSDCVFLCVRPHLAMQVLDPLVFRSGHQVVSVMAAVSLDQLRMGCAPATDIVRTIPLGYLEQGGCPLPACPDAGLLSALFAPDNPVLEVVQEAAFDQYFAVCAMIPGLLDLMDSASQWLGRATGDPDTAARYTRQLMTGFLAALRDGGAEVLGAERDALATDGTISLQMTQTLHKGGAHAALLGALDGIGARLGERT
jgi:pyrroline-5-carboxylate reductase